MGRLDDVTRRRIAALLLALVTVIVVLAVTDAGPFSDPPTQEERAADAVERFFDVARAEDYEALCRSLTEEARQVVQILGARLAAEEELRGCDEILAAQAGAALATTDVAIRSVRVSGNRAAVDVELRAEDSKQPQPRTFELVLINDRWKVNDFGG